MPRKRHPAIRASRYTAGVDAPVFEIDGVTIGILICRDSTDRDLAAALAARGAEALLVPTNNAMPADRGGAALVTAARRIDLEHASRLGVPIIRADVVGEWHGLSSDGASAITLRNGDQVCATPGSVSEILLADIALGRQAHGAEFRTTTGEAK